MSSVPLTQAGSREGVHGLSNAIPDHRRLTIGQTLLGFGVVLLDVVWKGLDEASGLAFAAASKPLLRTTSSVVTSMVCSASCLALARASRRAGRSKGEQAD